MAQLEGTRNRNSLLEMLSYAEFEELDLSLFYMKPVEQVIKDTGAKNEEVNEMQRLR